MDDVVDSIVRSYGPTSAQSRARIARYLQTLRSAGLNDTRVLAEYGLAYLKELREGPDRRYSGW